MVAGRERGNRRGWRIAGGANALVAVVLAVAIAVVLNVLVLRLPYRFKLSQFERHRLSAATEELLGRLQGEVRIVALMSEQARYHDDVRHLLHEYESAARQSTGLTITLEEVDPLRDIGSHERLLQEFDGLHADGDTHENVVVFECQGRRKYVPLSSLIQSEMTFRDDGILEQRTIGFRGEQEFSSALRSVVESVVPQLCFLHGHGEKDPLSFDEAVGYSEVARLLERDNMVVRQLQPTAQIPETCSVLVIAGPKQRLAEREVRAVRNYLDRHGRLLLLQDPGVESGLEPLLAEWGITLGDGVVLDPHNTLSGEEVVVEEYAAHPAVQAMKGLISVFYLPRAVRVDAAETKGEADRSRAVALAKTTEHAWEEFSLGRQNPLRYDQGVDLYGVQAVAAACERGSVGVDLNMNPTRLVVVGDSAFVANAALSDGVGGNAVFLLSALHWLVDREARMQVAVSDPSELRLGLETRKKRLGAYVRLGAVLPGLLLLCGLYVCRRRRQ
jgi:hypothetical protein